MNEKTKLSVIPIHSALTQPSLVLGGERELMMFVAMISGTMIFVALSVQSAIIGVVVWIIFSALLRLMAKSDPFMSKIYLRQLGYASYYPAKSTPFTYKGKIQ